MVEKLNFCRKRVKAYYRLSFLIWFLCVLLCGIIYLQVEYIYIVFWENIDIPKSMIKLGAEAGQHIYNNTYKVNLIELKFSTLAEREANTMLIENGHPLPYPHSDRKEMVRRSEGRYFLEDNVLHFTASDSSDPRSNDYRYELSTPLPIHPIVLYSIAFIALSFTAFLLWASSSYRKFILLLGINIIIIGGLLRGFEYFLSFTEPHLEIPVIPQEPENQEDNKLPKPTIMVSQKLPYDSNYAQINPTYYDEQDIPYSVKSIEHTWGIPVQYNKYLFREREFETPKPKGVYRIMVLGDSLTWGSGLKPEERYSGLLEVYLNNEFPHKHFEVLNFSRRGIPTTRERDILKEYQAIVQPDLILVGFCSNDTQPRSADYVAEKEIFDRQISPMLDRMSKGLSWLGLPKTARTLRAAIDNFAVKSGIIPSANVGMQRTYHPQSQEWQAFIQALQDIKAISDELNLSSPIFAVLNQGASFSSPTNYNDNDPSLPLGLRNFHQVEQAAAQVGFIHFNYEREMIEDIKPEEYPVNTADGHPSAKAHQIYAKKFF